MNGDEDLMDAAYAYLRADYAKMLRDALESRDCPCIPSMHGSQEHLGPFPIDITPMYFMKCPTQGMHDVVWNGEKENREHGYKENTWW